MSKIDSAGDKLTGRGSGGSGRIIALAGAIVGVSGVTLSSGIPPVFVTSIATVTF